MTVQVLEDLPGAGEVVDRLVRDRLALGSRERWIAASVHARQRPVRRARALLRPVDLRPAQAVLLVGVQLLQQHLLEQLEAPSEVAICLCVPRRVS